MSLYSEYPNYSTVFIQSNQEFQSLEHLLVHLVIILSDAHDDGWYFGEVELEFENVVVTCRPQSELTIPDFKLMDTSDLVQLECGTGEGLFFFIADFRYIYLNWTLSKSYYK